LGDAVSEFILEMLKEIQEEAVRRTVWFAIENGVDAEFMMHQGNKEWEDLYPDDPPLYVVPLTFEHPDRTAQRKHWESMAEL
jgi:hypothetical protein